MSNRTNNTLNNIKYGIMLQVANIILRFIVRTIFIQQLGPEYLGVGNVFNNVLNVISLTELGIGTAITYDMYKPIAENDEIKVNQYFKFYRNVYFLFGGIILLVGIVVLPFLNLIINDVPNVRHLEFIYLLHVVYSSSSYFFAHYRSLFSAYQLERVNSKNKTFFMFLKSFSEIVILFITKSYICYMIVQILIDVYSNYVVRNKAKEHFPFIKLNYGLIGKNERNNILKNAINMLSIKVGQTVIVSADNVIISSLISTLLVGVYGNYSMIISIISSTTFMIENAFVASVGNLCTEKNYQKKYVAFKKIRLGYSYMYGVITTCLICLFNPFIEIWLGKEYLLDMSIVIIVVVNLYLSGIRQPLEAFIYADGLFNYFKFKPWIEAGLNIIISIMLVEKMSLMGVFLGTVFSHMLTTFWFDAYIVYKHSFGEKVREYIKLYVVNVIWTILAVIISLYITTIIWDETILSFAGMCVLSVLVPSLIFVVLYSKDETFCAITENVISFLKKKETK